MLVVGAAMAWTSGCAGAGEGEAPPVARSAPASPLVALERAEFGEQEAGKPVWKATAARAVLKPAGSVGGAAGAADAKVVDLSEVEARFFEDGRAVTRGRSPQAVWRQAEHDLRLTGGVTLEAIDDKAGVAAHEARWDPATGRLLAKGSVRFWQGANRLTAPELRADRTLRRVELQGGVHGVFALGAGTRQLFDLSTAARRPR